MKKEVLIAVLIGLSMGLVITYGIYRVQNSINQPPVTDVAEVLEDSLNTVESSDSATTLSVHTPEPGTIQTEASTTVTGTTLANAHVVIFVNEEDYLTNSDSSGSFTQLVNLRNGTNVITTHVIDSVGQSAKEQRVVVVSDIYEQRPTASESASLDNEEESES